MCFLPIADEKGLLHIRSYDFTINERTVMYTEAEIFSTCYHFYSAQRC